MAGLNRLAGKVAVVTGAAVFTSMITLGMFEKYPRMKCAVLEAGAMQIGTWLDRLDDKGEVSEAFTPIKRKPKSC